MQQQHACLLSALDTLIGHKQQSQAVIGEKILEVHDRLSSFTPAGDLVDFKV